MKKVLFVGKNSQFNNAIALNLDVILKIEVVFKSKIEDVLEYFETFEKLTPVWIKRINKSLDRIIDNL